MIDGPVCKNPERTGPARGDQAITRRRFLHTTTVSLVAAPVSSLSCTLGNKSSRSRRPIRFGIVTDCHYADTEPAGSRFYSESLDKMSECVALMNDEEVSFLIELGDFKDQGKPPVEQETLVYLQDIEAVFQKFRGSTYHVLGNHDMDSISKPQFLSQVKNTEIDRARSYYSFDVPGVHGVVLDANYRTDGIDYDHGNFDWTDANIPPEELDWLKRDLAAAHGPAVVFIHQRLDGAGSVYVNNAPDVRSVLETAGDVAAVFQGHHHAGGYTNLAGIHYYTLKALVEGSGPENSPYAIVEVLPDDRILITGYRSAVSRQLAAGSDAQDARIRCSV